LGELGVIIASVPAHIEQQRRTPTTFSFSVFRIFEKKKKEKKRKEIEESKGREGGRRYVPLPRRAFSGEFIFFVLRSQECKQASTSIKNQEATQGK